MGLPRDHYERAFEAFLSARRIPYVGVNEARRNLLPNAGHLRLTTPEALGPPRHQLDPTDRIALADPTALTLPPAPLAPTALTTPATPTAPTLKSFDFVMYGARRNLLIDVKGRRLTTRATRATKSLSMPGNPTPSAPTHTGRLESWVTQDDITSLQTWQTLFGKGFAAAILFCYWYDHQPPTSRDSHAAQQLAQQPAQQPAQPQIQSPAQQLVHHNGHHYALRAVLVDDYAKHMKPRSQRWRTVDLPTEAFEQISHPFGSDWIDAANS